MQETGFYYLGKMIYKARWFIIGLWVFVILACLPFIGDIVAPFKTTGFIDENSASAKADEELTKKLGFNSYNKLLIIYHSRSLSATSDLFRAKIKNSLAGLKQFPLKHEILLPDEKNQISKDKHTAYAVVVFKSKERISSKLLTQFRAAVKTPKNMVMQLGGEAIFVDNVNKQTQVDLYKADFIATPVAIITLLLIFGTLVAALLPILLGGSCALIILTILYFFGHLFTLSIFTLNIALLLGLCLSLDYALFIISRFRSELHGGHDIETVIARTQATAGKAIFFSGVAVFVSLSALLLFPINILFSVGVGGLAAVFTAGLIAMIVLPAILGVLNTGINRLPVRFWKKNAQQKEGGFWHVIAEKVVHRPIICFLAILSLLLLLGYPFLSVNVGVSGFNILPKHSESRRFLDMYAEKFGENELMPIQLSIHSSGKPILSRKNLSNLYDFAHRLEGNAQVEEVQSIVTTKPSLTKEQYYNLYNLHKDLLSPNLKKFLAITTTHYLTVMSIISKHPENSPQTKALINKLRHAPAGQKLNQQLSGTPVNNVEVLLSIWRILPYALLWIMFFTYLTLLLLLRSVFLPLKAILMNILSLCASYGVLVWIFQEGHLHQLLNFEPQEIIDVSLLVIIFCAIFGFSMDYEVFLLTRIKECYEKTGDNDTSIIFGIEQSSRIITSAAIIVIFICASFMVADVLMVKAFGLGIAVAIFVDAFLIRTVLVPATMSLIKQWNWYLPQWLDKILPRL